MSVTKASFPVYLAAVLTPQSSACEQSCFYLAPRTRLPAFPSLALGWQFRGQDQGTARLRPRLKPLLTDSHHHLLVTSVSLPWVSAFLCTLPGPWAVLSVELQCGAGLRALVT